MADTHTYTYTHPNGTPIYTRTTTGEVSRTYWHMSGRTTIERPVQVGETVDGEPTYIWVQVDPVTAR